MSSAQAITEAPADSPATRHYNRVRRRLEMADFALGLVLLIVLLATGWSRALRDLFYRAAFQHYVPALFLYVLALIVIAKLLGLPLDFYGFRVEHHYHLSNQKLSAWI